MKEIIISEVFGPTIQGEGPSVGQGAIFVRFGRCNLDCSWCDTPYTWDWMGKNGTPHNPKDELSRWTPDNLVNYVNSLYNKDLVADARLVVITGGEPLIQRGGAIQLTRQLVAHGFHVEFETNGTFEPLDVAAPHSYNVSPKLPSSGVDPAKALKYEVLAQYARLAYRDEAALKFVIASDEDLAAANEVISRLDWPVDRIWLMPEGRDVVTLDKGIEFLKAADTEYQISDRLHVRKWGDVRGH